MSTQERGKSFYKLSLTCGTIPLLTGITIFVLWLFTRWGWLMFAGIANLYIGLLWVLIGSIYLIIYLRNESKSGRATT